MGEERRIKSHQFDLTLSIPDILFWLIPLWLIPEGYWLLYNMDKNKNKNEK
jgi:hypothetical protein